MFPIDCIYELDMLLKDASIYKLPRVLSSLMAQMVKNLPAMQETQAASLVRKIPWRREWQPTPVFLPREFHGQRSLAGYHSMAKSLIWLSDLTHTHYLPKMRRLFVIDSNKEKLQFWKSTAFSISKHTHTLALSLSHTHTHRWDGNKIIYP